MINGGVCLVNGGAGTIGSGIVDQLVAAGAAEIRVLDNFVRGRKENLADALASGRVHVIEGDIRDVDVVREATAGADLVLPAAIRITQWSWLALEVLGRHVQRPRGGRRRRGAQGGRGFLCLGLRVATDFPTTEQEAPWANDVLGPRCSTRACSAATRCTG
jgi:UDP-glucose 4-epimerase